MLVLARRYDLEERLVSYAVNVLTFINTLPRTIGGVHFTKQLTRSSTSPALNYGEAQAAESRKDFIHKIQIVLKELRETQIALKILHRVGWGNHELLDALQIESRELVAIFTTIVKKSKDAT